MIIYKCDRCGIEVKGGEVKYLKINPSEETQLCQQCYNAILQFIQTPERQDND